MRLILPSINDHQLVAHLIEAAGGNANPKSTLHIFDRMMHGENVSK